MPGAKIWTGTLSFVLVSIPVELVSAVRNSRVSFRLMHRTDNALLQRRMFCPNEQIFVHAEHIVNGYQVGDHDYVIVREDEYKAIEPKRSQSIEITAFVDAKRIDSIYYDRPYYLLPRKGGAKAYQMLTEVLEGSEKAGLARFVLHSREHLVAVRARQHHLEVMTLHFHDQLRDTAEIVPDLKAQPSKVKALTTQINKAKGRYDPERYLNEHRKHVLEHLEQKVKEGLTVTVEYPEEETDDGEPQSQTDLIAALEESLSKVKNK